MSTQPSDTFTGSQSSGPGTFYRRYLISVDGRGSSDVFSAQEQIDPETYRKVSAARLDRALSDVSVSVLAEYRANPKEGRWDCAYFGDDDEDYPRGGGRSCLSSSPSDPNASVPDELVPTITEYLAHARTADSKAEGEGENIEQRHTGRLYSWLSGFRSGRGKPSKN
ncbi:hypothetical protein L202_01940 [Cryptococcus amylolentus CBS 6039]|uniref:Uncharacterized protein n=2 Tax=Cryptococcus amylolentus TaxID=104669 RepID=A0A1E3HYY7_9TREE|nr:hypothetical protein L202_01940 [Cryptococcus amylolentus CBS 6039]ODN81519.1 hypothetical protein L202_01940 [Cryptococcus amylolentus CBS 6039]ODO10248.1 hypothetical protein I350_02477 [Cryptococcus amylolentus CBS 6273]